MQWQQNTLLWVLFAIALKSCIGQQPDDKGTNDKTKQVLNYISGLSKQGKFLSGQYIGVSRPNMDLSVITEIFNKTGKVPAIFECDYANGFWSTTPPQRLIDHSCNSALKDHWNKDGLINVCSHFPNPVSPNGGELRNRSNLVFTDLLDLQTTTGQRWRSFLDIVADGFKDLQDSNVTVMYRPFHEMNGGWFWWGKQNPTVFKSVWIDVFNYFTNTKNLHNLLWIYSPDQGADNSTMYYPGDNYVDIVGLDVYVDDPNVMKNYEEMTSLNKPIVIGEVGPKNTDGQFDYSRWPIAIKSKFPKISYFLAWSGPWSPVANKNPYALFNDPHVINRGDIKLNSSFHFSNAASPKIK